MKKRIACLLISSSLFLNFLGSITVSASTVDLDNPGFDLEAYARFIQEQQHIIEYATNTGVVVESDGTITGVDTSTEEDEVSTGLNLSDATVADTTFFTAAIQSNIAALTGAMNNASNVANISLQLAYISNVYQNIYYLAMISTDGTLPLEESELLAIITQMDGYIDIIESGVVGGSVSISSAEDVIEYLDGIEFSSLKIAKHTDSAITLYEHVLLETVRLLLDSGVYEEESNDTGVMFETLSDLLVEVFKSKASYKTSTSDALYDYTAIVNDNPSLSATAVALNNLLDAFEDNATTLGNTGVIDQILKDSEESAPTFGLLVKPSTGLNFTTSLFDTISAYFNSQASIYLQEAVFEFLEFAKDYDFSETLDEQDLIKVELEKKYVIESLATVQRVEDAYERDYSINAWEPISGKTFELSSAYIAMLATTAVYTPFVSNTSSQDYLEALAYLAGNSSDDILTLYDKIKDYKKPLYAFTLDSSCIVNPEDSKNTTSSNYANTYSGDATRVTLSMFQDYVTKGTNVIFASIQGEFVVGEDTNSYTFYKAHGDATSASDGGSFYGNVIIADDKVTTSNYTPVVFSLGTEAGNPALGRLLMSNVFLNLRNTSVLKKNDHSVLYVDVIGNIILSDGTVIVPAAANPIFYHADGGYNPYTVAFQNNYPSFVADSTSTVVYSEQENGKMFYQMNAESYTAWYSVIAGVTTAVAGVALTVFSGGTLTVPAALLIGGAGAVAGAGLTTGLEQLSNRQGMIEGSSLHINSIKSNSVKGATTPFFSSSETSSDGVSMFPYFYTGDNEMLSIYTKLTLKGDSVNKNFLAYLGGNNDQDNAVLHFNSVFTPAGKPVFPYIVSDRQIAIDTDYYAAKMIASNMYWFYTFDGTASPSDKSTGSLLDGYLFENFIIEGLQGTKTATQYEKDILVSNVVLLDETNAFETALLDIAETVLDTIADIQGVLGIVPADSNPIFGSVMRFFVENSLYFYIMFVAVFIFRYLRRGDLLYVGVMSVASCIFFYLFCYILPVYVPMAYNSTSSIVTENLISEILLYNSERYSTTYANASIAGLTEDYDTKTTSITIYRMNEKQLKVFSEQYDIDFELFRYGDIYILDSNIGLYVQGDSLKVNLDVFLYNNPIYGSYVTDDGVTRYVLSSDKMSSSAFEYYSVFYLLEDGFVSTLNSLLDNFTIERRTTTYLDGFVKDSFVVYNYMLSAPFLYPDEYQEIQGLDYVTQILKYEQAFPDASDFLKIGTWIHEPTDEMKESLWYKTLFANGYYDTELGAMRRDSLIEYVNYQTKLYMIRHLVGTSIVSDENLIKSIACNAMFAFNARVSELGSMLYPISYNQEELGLHDVFLSTFTEDADRFISLQFDLVAYVLDEYGVMCLFVLVLILIIALCVILVMNLSFPLLYIALSVNILVRLIIDKPLGPALRGFVKSMTLLLSIYTIFLLVLTKASEVLSGLSLVVVLLAIFLLIFSWLFALIKGFFKNVFEFGDGMYGTTFSQNPVTGMIVTNVLGKYDSFVSNSKWSEFSEPLNHNFYDSNEYFENGYNPDMIDYQDGYGGTYSVADYDRTQIQNQHFVMGSFNDYISDAEFDNDEEN